MIRLLKHPLAKQLPRTFAALWALVAVTAFALECKTLLHTNLATVTVDFGKKATSEADEMGPQVELFASAEGDGFFASNGKTLGYVNANTGKYEPLVEPRGNVHLNVHDSSTDVIYGEFYRRARPKGADVDVPEVMDMTRAFFLNKKTKKVVRSPTFGEGAVPDYLWGNSPARFYPYAENDVLYLVDVETGTTRSLSLPFVPNRVLTAGEANAVVLLAPGRAPLFLDVATGKAIAIDGLPAVKMPSANNPGATYHVVMRGKTVSFREGAFIHGEGEQVRKPLVEFAVDLEKRTSEPLTHWKESYYYHERHADGYLETHFNRDALSPANEGDDVGDWSAKFRRAIDTQQVVINPVTGKPILPAANWIDVRDGVGQAMIHPNNMYGKDGLIESLHLFDVASGETKALDLPKGFRVEEFAYDPKRKQWLLYFVPDRFTATTTGKKPGEPFLGFVSREGVLVERVPSSTDLIGLDGRQQFVGFMSREWMKGNTYIHLETPKLGEKPKVPAEGWPKASKRLGALMTKKEASAAYPELLAYFAKKVYRTHPKTAAGAYLNLFSASNLFAGRILTDHPELIEVFKKYPVVLDKLSGRTYTAHKKATTGFLNVLMAGGSFREANAAYFHALRPFLERTPKAKIEDTVDTIAESFKNLAMRENHDLSEVFESKVYKFVRHSFSETFGLKEGPITDLTVTQANGELKLLALGSHGVEGGTKTRFGMDYRELGKYTVDPKIGPNQVIADTEVSWLHAGERFSAKVTAKTTSRTMADIVKFVESPDYDRLLKNKKLTTAVVTGSNLLEDAADVLGEYLQAFKDRGYKFTQDEHIPDLHGFLKEKFASGDIDVFIKEAHSDGDEKNLFRIFKTSELKIGRKKLPNGEEEVVYLVFPSKGATSSENDGTTRLISNTEFGEWMRARETVDVPLYYLNGSCWSATKAKAEIQAAATPMLVEIPSLTTLDTFVAEKDATMYEVLMGLLNRRSYDQIEEAALKDADAKTGESNILAWPSVSGKATYLEKVLANFTQPIDIEVKVFDSKGRPYNIDER